MIHKYLTLKKYQINNTTKLFHNQCKKITMCMHITSTKNISKKEIWITVKGI